MSVRFRCFFDASVREAESSGAWVLYGAISQGIRCTTDEIPEMNVPNTVDQTDIEWHRLACASFHWDKPVSSSEAELEGLGATVLSLVNFLRVRQFRFRRLADLGVGSLV